MIALEYQPGCGKHEANFHYNQLALDGGFEHGIETNGYHPITILPDEAAYRADFLALLDELRRRDADLGEVTVAVYSWAAKHAHLWNR